MKNVVGESPWERWLAWRWSVGAWFRLSPPSSLRAEILRRVEPRNLVEADPPKRGGKAAIGGTHGRVIPKRLEVPGGLASLARRSNRHRSRMKGTRAPVVATGGRANRPDRTDLRNARWVLKDPLSEATPSGNRAGNRTGSRTVLAG